MTKAYFFDIERTILSNISKAQKSIEIAVAWFTNPNIFNCLNAVQRKGITLTIILSDDIVNFSNKNISLQKFIDEGIDIRITRFPHLMHHKFCIIDDRLIISGSYNWTLAAERRNFENIIMFNDLNLVSQFSIEFLSLKEKSEKLKQISSTTFRSYMTEIEKSYEIELLTEGLKDNFELPIENIVKPELEFSEELEEELDMAQYLYLKGNHQESIEICLKLIEDKMNIPEVYELIASSKWRQKKYKDQIDFALKAIEVDNLYYPAYNMLGIGYACIKNATKSIENYQICINAQPNLYVYFRNRANSYLELENDLNIPMKLRDQFRKKANTDLEKVIELTNNYEATEPNYRLYSSRGIAYLKLNKILQAKNDFYKALEFYSKANELEQDTHEFKEIKLYLKEIERLQR